MTPQDMAEAREIAAKKWAAEIRFEEDRLEALDRAAVVLARHTARYLHAGEESLAARHAAAHVLLADRHRLALDARLAKLQRRIAAQM